MYKKKKNKKQKITHQSEEREREREKFIYPIYRSWKKKRKRRRWRYDDGASKAQFQSLGFALRFTRRVHNDRAIKIFPRHRCWITMHISIFREKEISRYLQSNQGNNGENEMWWIIHIIEARYHYPRWFRDNLTLSLLLSLAAWWPFAWRNCNLRIPRVVKRARVWYDIEMRKEKWNCKKKKMERNEARGNWTSIWNNWIVKSVWPSYNSPNSCN